ncbi:hypothetical protein [Pasteurella multocida]|uniref:hypothetical protein n=1 Tax=Pasteurella multocida TaxID=747 RepID=UPI002A5816C8|nr:hypothetical protein [Pasteurella multocida]MDY0480147.1 hypothetical protein [Pasteurella multocida]MDY0581229.1 hypothetical protein [Pasteurella multocida]MDY0606257.1 hypothetical protein [Pasteurella multocida]MDY0616941.1 hypothetical protein [Pasteurella multocida]
MEEIKSINDLFELLDRTNLDDNIKITDIDLSKITNVKVKVNGKSYNGEINSDLCYSLVNFHDNLLRLYCISKYKEENLARLSDEDRAKLKLTFVVNDGCTEWNVDINEVASNIATNLMKHTIDKMNGTQLFISVTLIILCTLGYKLYDRYCQKEEKKAEETTKNETVDKFAEVTKEMANLNKRAQEMFVEHLRTYNNPTQFKASVFDEEEYDVVLNQEEIAAITRRPRRKLDNDSKIQKVEIESVKKSNDKYIVTCRLPGGNYTFPVNVDTSFIDKEETDLIFEAFRDNKPLYILADFKSYQGNIEKGNASGIMLELLQE